MTGRVLWFNPKKGYGFAQGEDGMPVYLHKTKLIDCQKQDLLKGVSLEFSLEPGEKCRRAVDIRVSPTA